MVSLLVCYRAAIEQIAAELCQGRETVQGSRVVEIVDTCKQDQASTGTGGAVGAFSDHFATQACTCFQHPLPLGLSLPSAPLHLHLHAYIFQYLMVHMYECRCQAIGALCGSIITELLCGLTCAELLLHGAL